MKQNLEKIAAADFMLQQFKIGRGAGEASAAPAVPPYVQQLL